MQAKAKAAPSKQPRACGRRATSAKAALRVNEKAPDFQLLDERRRKFKLSSLQGGPFGIGAKRCVLYFFPQAETPGCTQEACEVRAAGGG